MNFPRLHAAGIPVIHYWRPFLPQNSTPDALERIMYWVTRYADCTVAVGTKVKPTALNQIAGLWPQLADPHLEAQAADSVWPGRPGSGCTTSRTATPATLSSRPTAAPWPTSWAAPTALAS
ncbi:hypothetical protein BX257_1421 [Streptomyces sp. 3212.3]|nr:hypothetical protein BX257_1421 [Streptomyces sp. 3212.3]